MKVLHVIPSLGVGGAEQMVLNLIRSLPADVESTLITLRSPTGTHLERVAGAFGIQWVALNKGAGFSVRAVRDLNQAIGTYRPDVIHTHLYSSAYVLLAPRSHSARVRVHTLHTLADKEQPLVGRWLLRTLGRRVKVVPIAGAVAESAQAQGYRILESIVPNGIILETSGFTSPPRCAPHFVVLAAGRFVELKNHRLLLHAFAHVLTEVPSARLLLAGDGPLRADLERLAADLSINASVEFLGLVADMPRAYARADVFAMSSDYEGHPLSVMEAMAHGLPVAATRVGGLPDLVMEGVTGHLTPPGDGPALATAIVSLLQPERLAAFSRASFEWAREQFSAKTMARRYLQVYERA